MALDTNPFANSNQATPTNQGQSPQQFSYPGAITNMIKAIQQGNDQYKQQQQQNIGQPQFQAPGSAVPGAIGPTSVGGANGPSPLNMAPSGGVPMPMPNPSATMPTTPSAMSGGLGDSAFTGGSSPVSMDPVTQALMSPIPGM